jgi:LuxR family maltose regulon positive regulatory protein
VNSFPTTVTFLSTDIEGSTRLVRQPRERYEEVLAEHRRLLRESFERHRGEVVDTQGDAFFVAFERAGDALASALAAKASLDRHEWPDGAKVHVRFGLHTGEAVLGEHGYTGAAVHRAARICAAGHGGQVLLSQATAAIVEEDEPQGLTLRDLGEYELDGIDRPERIFEAVQDERRAKPLELKPARSRPVILATKLGRPPVRDEHVARDRLLELLRGGAARRLTLVTAPPGFGKTTLLAEWAAEEGSPVAWLSLDDDDNDPTRFLAYTIEALRTAAPDVGRRALAALGAAGERVVDVVLALLVNDLSARETGMVLVLDDYHVITNTEIHGAVAFLVERLPESLRLVIATREDPPLPLGRLRARGELGELRAAELRFSEEETSMFLNDVLALGLASEDVGRLQMRTEGWPAALYLAALSLRGTDDAKPWILSFAGDDRHVVDYLTAEVLARQPAELRAFLLHTSILDRLCGPLCDAVTERNGSTHVLEDLERSNLLLIPLDNKREWYRYHHLFGDLLRHELERTDEDSLPLLHRRASAWCRKSGLLVEAARHAKAAGDVDTAVELVGCCWPVFHAQGQLEIAGSWLKVLPEAVVADNWLLCLAGLTTAAHMQQLDEAERWLELAERAPAIVRNNQQPDAPLAAGRAYLRIARGDVSGAIEAARQGLASPSAAEPTGVLTMQIILGMALWWSGEPTEARASLEHATRAAEETNLVAGKVEALGFRAAIALEEGDLQTAEELTRDAREVTREAELEEHPFTGMALIVRGMLLMRRGELETAKSEIERAIALAERDPFWLLTVYGSLALAEIRHREHDLPGARRLLSRARAIIQAFPGTGPDLARVERAEKLLGLRAARRSDATAAPFWELSERELAVLQRFPGRLSQREIAAELYVSLNTVKTHARSIFRKLGVTSRAEAVRRARELGLLS